MQFYLYLVDDHSKSFYEEARKEYEKRLSRYCKLKVIKVKNIEYIEKKLKEEKTICLLSPGKNVLSSEALAEEILKSEVQGKSSASFLIGSSFPSDFLEGKEIKTFSISPMDFSQGLLSAVFLEQIYRAYRIIKKEPYHK